MGVWEYGSMGVAGKKFENELVDLNHALPIH
jgi:hypothetical protein